MFNVKDGTSMSRVSIIIPFYNEEKRIKRCIKSLLGQTYQDIELVLVNDGSTDRSREYVESFTDERIVLINQKNKGRTAARNAALHVATGKYVAVQDADDYSHKRRIEEQVRLAEGEQLVPVIGTGIYLLKERKVEKRCRTSDREAIKRCMKRRFRSGAVHTNTILTERELVQKVGGWREKFTTSCEDGDLVDRLYETGKTVFLNTDKSLYYYDVNNGSVVNTDENIRMQIFKKYCKDRRRSGMSEPDSYAEYLDRVDKSLSLKISHYSWFAIWKVFKHLKYGR